MRGRGGGDKHGRERRADFGWRVTTHVSARALEGKKKGRKDSREGTELINSGWSDEGRRTHSL